MSRRIRRLVTKAKKTWVWMWSAYRNKRDTGDDEKDKVEDG